MSIKGQRLCAWAGFAFMATFLVGFLIAGFIPPSPGPNGSAHEMAEYFRDHAFRIRLGVMISMFACALLIPWSVAISVQLSRIEGGRFTPLAWTQMILGGLLSLTFIIPQQVLQAATYRPERSDESIQSLIDTGWLMFMGITSIALLQGIALGIAILNDDHEKPVYPRWSAYFSIWAVTMTAPGGLVPFFKTGPFTWSGLLVWWIPLVAFASWIVLFTLLTLRAIGQQAIDSANRVNGPATAHQ